MENDTNNGQYSSSYVNAANSQEQMQKSPKKKHTGLIIGLSVAAVLIVAAGLTFIFAKDILINKFMLMTKTEREYFEWVAQREVDAVCNAMTAADTINSIKSRLLPGEDQGLVKTIIRTHTTKAFTDLLGIYPIKDTELDLAAAVTDKGASVSIMPLYNGSRLFMLNALYDLENGRLEAELPDYKEGIVDFSSVLEREIEDGKTIGELIGEYAKEAGESMKQAQSVDSGAAIKSYRRYTSALISSIEDVELMTDSYASVGERSVKCVEIRLSLSNEQLKKQLKDISAMLLEDYAEQIKKAEEKTGKSIRQTDIDRLIDSISNEISGRLTLYADNKADLIAVDASVSYAATSVGAGIRWEKTDAAGFKGNITLSVNKLEAVDIAFEANPGVERRTLHVQVSPAGLVEAFLGDYRGLVLEYDYFSEENASSSILRLNKGDEEWARFEQIVNTEAFSGHILEEGSKTVYPFDTITESDYFSVEGAVGFGLGLLDRINEPVLEDKIDELLAQLLGEQFDLDLIRNWYENGMFDMFSMKQGDSRSETGQGKEADGVLSGKETDDISVDNAPAEPTPVPNPYGLNEAGYPVTRVEKTVGYPDAIKDYYYSYAELAQYAEPAQYRGRTFIMPAPQEVTPEAFEAEKTAFLKDYENSIPVDQSTACVEWGDEVYLDIMPYLYGVAVEAFHYSNSYAKIGDEMYGDGLDEELTGMKVGEQKSITTVLNQKYGDFAGIEATFLVTVTRIDRYVVPEWSESFICGYLGYESLDACSDMLMDRLVVETEVSDEEIELELESLSKAETVYREIPEGIYYGLWNRYYNEIYDMTCTYGQTPEENFAEQGMDALELYELMDSDLKTNLPDYCFYAAVADKEGLYLTGAQVMEAVNYYMDLTESSTYEEMTDIISLDRIVDYEIESRIADIILSTAVIKPYGEK